MNSTDETRTGPSAPGPHTHVTPEGNGTNKDESSELRQIKNIVAWKIIVEFLILGILAFGGLRVYYLEKDTHDVASNTNTVARDVKRTADRVEDATSPEAQKAAQDATAAAVRDINVNTRQVAILAAYCSQHTSDLEQIEDCVASGLGE